MPRAYRLSRSDFEEIKRKRASRVRGAFFTISYLPNTLSHPRMGIVVSKKVALRAVDRNVIERRAKAVLRKVFADHYKPFDYILVAQKGVLAASPEDLETDITTLIKKSSAYSPRATVL